MAQLIHSNTDFLTLAMALIDTCIDEVMAQRAGGMKTMRGLVITPDRAQEALKAQRQRVMPTLTAQYVRLMEHAANAQERIPLLDMWEFMEATAFERFCSLVALSSSYDRKYALLYGYLNDNLQQSTPNLGCAMALYSLIDQPDEREIAELFCNEHGFAAYIFRTPVQEGLEAELVLTDKARLTALGSDAVSSPVRRFAQLLPAVEEELDYGLEKNRLPQLIMELLNGEQNSCVQLIGPDGSGRKRLLQAFSAKNGLRVLRVDTAMLPADQEALRNAARDLCIEALVGAELVLLDDTERMDAQRLEVLLRVMTERMKITLLSAETAKMVKLPVGVLSLQADFPLPTAEAARELWLRETQDEQIADYMMHKVRMTPGRILDTVRRAKLEALLANEPELSRKRIVQAVRAGATHKMEGLARRVNAFYTWDDLVVSEETERELRLFSERVKYRGYVMENWNFKSRIAYGTATSALFYGTPGTGKTMAAQVLANELDLDLYRVDLSQIMNKYIGETEKNLSKIFDEAALSNGILFFDEADALFAKRTDVGDSNDKYANAETAFLLQKIEEFDGLIILSTNLAYNFDDAFKRRINYMINFTLPDKAQRRELWRKVFPKEMHAEEHLDMDFLAESFELSGSAIKSVAVAAAYRAAAEGKQIGMENVIRALKHEYAKNGEILIRTRLREYDID